MLSGTITTDGTIGELLFANITAWDLDIIFGATTANLTEANSALDAWGAASATGITATSGGNLAFDASSSADAGFGFQEGAPNFAASWALCSAGGTGCFITAGTESLINGSNVSSLGLPDEVISFATVSSVPIPAAAWLFGSGLFGLIGLARRKGYITHFHSSQGGTRAAFFIALE
jgi:hypothetical protein